MRFHTTHVIGVVASAALALCLMLLTTPIARAQGGDAATRATARSLFEEGVGYAEAGKWGDAAEKFQRSLALRPSQVVAFNLATALMELGRLVEASELLEGVRRDATTTPQMKRRVDTLLETLRPQLAWLTVQLQGDNTGVAVLDGQPLPQAALGVARAVDPGKRTLEVRVDGRVVWSQSITVNAGQSEAAVIDVPSEPEPAPTQATPAPTPAQTAAAAATPTTDATEHTAPDREDGSSGPWLWVGIGGVVVIGAVVAVIAATSGGTEPAAPLTGSLGDGVIEVPAQ